MSSNRWSQSRFNLAESCLSAYENRYERNGDRIPELYDPIRETGKGVHACIDRYKIELKASGIAQDLSLIPEIVENYFSTDPEVTTSAHYLDVLQVTRAFAVSYRHDPNKYFGGEFLSDRTLPESDVIVEGYPDHIELMSDDAGPIIVSEDVKAGYSTTVTDANKLQGEIESWKLLDWFPDSRVGWRVRWPRADKTSPIAEFKPSFAPALEARLRSVIARVDRAREKNHWPATPGIACTYCPLASNCRERTVLAELDIIVSDRESAKKAASDLVLLEAAKKQRVAQVKAWSGEHGPVEAGVGKAAGFITKSSGDKIGDPALMVLAIGKNKLLLDGEDDLEKRLDINEMLIVTGFREAVREKLLVINGKKTMQKGVKDDARFSGLWVPGDSKTSFKVYSTTGDDDDDDNAE